MVSPKTSVTMFLLVTCAVAALATDKIEVPLAPTGDSIKSESTVAKESTLIKVPEPTTPENVNVSTTTLPPKTTTPSNGTTSTTTTLPTTSSTTAKPTTSTDKPSSTSTTTTTTTTTTAKPSTSTTTHKPTSTISPNSSTTATPDVTTPGTPSSDKSRNWDAPSFLGGMVLAFGIVAVGFVGYRFFYLGRGGAYHTL